ncbi:NepR family anti-sigma factor [Sphingomonas sinipercae]|uniref:NepR family anti-sigma factor n=1 Tax=Sphingomonas sinipercae TaxID=2714944 RepID=UPI001FE92350|nr:NepR family anti-sigma factor [Sphingomonas sinipercae]
MSDKQKGDSINASDDQSKLPPKSGEKKPGKQRANDVGRALRSVYDETLREDVPDDFKDLLGKLS